MKKQLFIVITLALVLSICGCAESATNVIGTGVAASDATQTDMLTVIPSMSLSQSPTPSITEPEAPEVDGCKSEVVDGKVLYYAEEGNTYGLEAGELFGEFVPNVNIVTENENNFEGGWVLKSKAVHALLQQASAEASEDVTETKIVLPLDISGLNENDELDINVVSPFYGEEVYDEYSFLLLEFGDSTLTSVNSFDTGDQDALLSYTLDKIEFSYIKETGEKDTRSFHDHTFDLKGSNPISCYSEYFLSEDVQRSFFFGDAVVDIKSPFLIN